MNIAAIIGLSLNHLKNQMHAFDSIDKHEHGYWLGRIFGSLRGERITINKWNIQTCQHNEFLFHGIWWFCAHLSVALKGSSDFID